MALEYIYAALLLHSARRELSEENIRKVIESAGIQVDGAKIKSLVATLSSVDIDQVVQSAMATTAIATPSVAPPTPTVEEKAPAEEKTKEEKKEEAEEAFEGLGTLFE
jgi:large subunit ribosomal protein L12